MSLSYVLSPEARADYDTAFDYYDAIDQDLSAEFDTRTADAYALISAHPKIGRELQPGVRRVLVRKFPYAVIYREINGKIEVISVLHTSRDPAEWQGRT